MNQTYETNIDSVGTNTKDRIIDAAEQLFAERGFDAASLRAITGKAGVNLAAVNYHFKSKEVLIRKVLARRLAPLTRRRLELLDQHEARSGSKPVPVEDIFRSLVEPLFELRAGSSGGHPIASIMGRLYTEPRLSKIFFEELGNTVPRFVAALHRALPHLSKGDLLWRTHFAVGAMIHTLAGLHILEFHAEEAFVTSDAEGIIERLTAFMSAGLKAPVPGETW
jgi:AcrR family transcriptional regulator